MHSLNQFGCKFSVEIERNAVGRTEEASFLPNFSMVFEQTKHMTNNINCVPADLLLIFFVISKLRSCIEIISIALVFRYKPSEHVT